MQLIWQNDYVSKYITEQASLMQEVDAYKRNQPLSIYLSCNEIFVIRHFDEIMKIITISA